MHARETFEALDEILMLLMRFLCQTKRENNHFRIDQENIESTTDRAAEH